MQHLLDFGARLALRLHRHERCGGLADRAAVPGKFDFVQRAIRVPLYPEMNFVAAGRIIAMHEHGCVWERPEIPRSARVIENDLLIQLFEFCVHEKKRTAFCRISTIWSISSVVL